MMVIGYTTGVYDLFHIGHLNLLRRAKAECDRLIVGVTTDELSFTRKGKYPIVPFEERLAIIESLRCVDQAVPQEHMDKVSAWRELQFHKMFVGDDWRGSKSWTKLEAEFAAHRVEIVYFPYTQHTSSTKLRSIVDELLDASS